MRSLPLIRTIDQDRRAAKQAAMIVLAALLCAAPFQAAVAQVAPAMGSAGNYAVLSGAAVTCTGSTVDGDTGSFVPLGPVVHTGCVITGSVQPGDASAVAAARDFLGAYDTLTALPLAQCDGFLSGNLADVWLAPGTYCFDAAVSLGGQLTLDGPADGVWIYRIGTGGTGAMTGTGFSVRMAGGGQASNVYWWIADAVSMTNSDVQGTLLAGAATTFTGGSLNGRSLAKGAVTLTRTSVTARNP